MCGLTPSCSCFLSLLLEKGASGAGKSTLLDVLLGRKTLGRTSGSITLNGVPANKGLLQSLTAFAEQDDIHLGTATVEEALEFSAKLRMPKGVTAKQRQVALGRITRVLELEAIQSRLVGTLSKNELKRLTIGVELSKLPSIVACDEPTSFLSANNAAVVIKALRRVAKTGRTIIATIHQRESNLVLLRANVCPRRSQLICQSSPQCSQLGHFHLRFRQPHPACAVRATGILWAYRPQCHDHGPLL